MNATFRALTSVVRVEIDDAMPHADLAQAVIAPYSRVVAPAELSYRLSAAGFERDAGLHAASDSADVVPLFELDLYEQLIARAAPGWLLHAAAVEVDGEAFVFAGPSGAGKTTMALALLARGHRLVTEEIVWISADHQVRGLCRALHLRDTSTLPTGWDVIEYRLRPAHTIAEPLLVVPPVTALTHDPLPVRALIWLTHGPDRRGGLQLLSARDAMARFWDATLRQDDAGLAVAVSVLRSRPAYRLASTGFDEALGAVQRLVSQPK